MLAFLVFRSSRLMGSMETLVVFLFYRQAIFAGIKHENKNTLEYKTKAKINVAFSKTIGLSAVGKVGTKQW